MSDIQLRFNKDKLVLSRPIEYGLKKLFLDYNNLELINIFDLESLRQVYVLDKLAGFSVFVANTKNIVYSNIQNKYKSSQILELCSSSISLLNSIKVQHILVEIGTPSFDIDSNSRQSLLKAKDEYVQLSRIYEDLREKKSTSFDGYLLSDIKSSTQLKCALMGLRQVTSHPIFTKVDVDSTKILSENFESFVTEILDVAKEFEANVFGFSVNCDLNLIKQLLNSFRNYPCPKLLEFKISDDVDINTFQQCVKTANKNNVQFYRISGNTTSKYSAILLSSTLS